ncbi:hypothetical protein VNO77_33240 [Canavalia gladiata]|uniref:Uncharacterized protein n=1 Tax=Canavalia gladiata TaxID=3824 RepID=A0AAN9KEC5_CANGL
MAKGAFGDNVCTTISLTKTLAIRFLVILNVHHVNFLAVKATSSPVIILANQITVHWATLVVKAVLKPSAKNVEKTCPKNSKETCFPAFAMQPLLVR